MAIKKNFRSDNTYMIVVDDGDNPKLGAKVLSDGRESLFLDYYFGYQKSVNEETGKEVVRVDRKRESLSLYLWQSPRTPMERQQNKDTLELAKKIRYERSQQLLEDTEGYRLKKKNNQINFLDYFQSYIDRYTKKDIRVMEMALRDFRNFVQDTPEYKRFVNFLKPSALTQQMVKDFVEYLQANHNGEGAKTTYARFKKVVLYAVDNDVIIKNPCKGISVEIDVNRMAKDVLSNDEIATLLATNVPNQNLEIRRAFILSLYCGIRWCDVKDLTFGNVDYSNGFLKFEQSKTKGHSSKSGVAIPLNEDLLKLIGEPKTDNPKEEKLFELPSHTMCLKSLRRWVAKAKINKHITWHCARHSFATNILSNGANVKVVADLLGHSSLTYTERYVRAVDEQKRAAINSMPKLNL